MSGLLVELPRDLEARLNVSSARLHRPRSQIAAEAIGEFVLREDEAPAEIEAGIREADEGVFATEADAATVFSKYLGPSST